MLDKPHGKNSGKEMNIEAQKYLFYMFLKNSLSKKKEKKKEI